MEEYYAECRKPHKHLEWNFDGCQEFTPRSDSHELTPCRVCGCYRSHHRKVVPKVKKVVVEHTTEVVYTRCQKIHSHNNSVDGCQEFLERHEYGYGYGLKGESCATCSCDKNFHLNEIITSTTTTITTSSK